MKYFFILENKEIYPVEKMCSCMSVSKNAFYTWKNKHEKGSFTTKTILLKQRIEEIFLESKEIYGSYRIQKQLEREHIYYSRSYIAYLMKKMGLRSVLKRKFVITTNSNHSHSIANNLLDRDFSSEILGEKWVSDITYVRVADDWTYLTTIIDLADRKIVGWTLSKDMTTENTVYQAWINARRNREISSNHIFHSDRGVQYASTKMSIILNENTFVKQSMSRKGNCWDNAVAESFFKTIKYECLYRYTFYTFEDLYSCIEEYINWYNNKRLHSSLGYITPLEKEIQLRGFNKVAA